MSHQAIMRASFFRAATSVVRRSARVPKRHLATAESAQGSRDIGPLQFFLAGGGGTVVLLGLHSLAFGTKAAKPAARAVTAADDGPESEAAPSTPPPAATDPTSESAPDPTPAKVAATAPPPTAPAAVPSAVRPRVRPEIVPATPPSPTAGAVPTSLPPVGAACQVLGSCRGWRIVDEEGVLYALRRARLGLGSASLPVTKLRLSPEGVRTGAVLLSPVAADGDLLVEVSAPHAARGPRVA